VRKRLQEQWRVKIIYYYRQAHWQQQQDRIPLYGKKVETMDDQLGDTLGNKIACCSMLKMLICRSHEYLRSDPRW
jgi:hypothetical protein